MQSKAGWGHQCVHDRDRWRDVRIHCSTYDFEKDGSAGRVKLTQIRHDTADIARMLLRESFREGPEAAASAHEAYRSWVHGVVEVGGHEPMPADAKRWSDFHDRWNRFLLDNPTRRLGTFGEIDCVDFSRALKRSRGRGKSV
jgi:hypothetical protein